MPYKYWGHSTLNKIAGLIETPKKLDPLTEQKEYLSYAGVLVEFKINKSPPERIGFSYELGGKVAINVEYDWLPVKCSQCDTYGHAKEVYRKAQATKFNNPTQRPPSYANIVHKCVRKERVTDQDGFQKVSRRKYYKTAQQGEPLDSQDNGQLNEKTTSSETTQSQPEQTRHRVSKPPNRGDEFLFY